MPYTSDSNNGQRPSTLKVLGELGGFLVGKFSGLGDYYTALRITGPVIAEQMRKRQERLGATIIPGMWSIGVPRVITPTTRIIVPPTPVRYPTTVTAPTTPKPSINVASVAPVPSNVAPPSDGNGYAPPLLAPGPDPMTYRPQYGAPVYAQSAGSGPPLIPGSPDVEVGTLPVGGGASSSMLAGLSPSSPILLAAAIAAYFLLGDSSSKPKRRRRR